MNGLIQVRQLREYTPKGQTLSIEYDSPTHPEIIGPTFEEILKTLPDRIKTIPEAERYNLFCTLHEVPSDVEARKKKPWGRQPYLMFDIDDVSLEDQNQDVKYREIVQAQLRIGPKNIIQSFSGGGYHFILKLKHPIEDPAYFSKNKMYYDIICASLEDQIKKAGLSGKLDSQVFAPNRLTRLPYSKNIKPDRESWVRLCYLPDTLESVDLDLKLCTGMPVVGESEQLSAKELSYFKIDSATVLTDCGFLNFCKTEQASVSEPQWYAMLSIVSRLENGDKLIHEYSKYHPTYNPDRTDQKAAQSKKAYGPRTCEAIEKLWEGCPACPMYKKCRSPISLKSQDFIATEHSGFHTIGMKGKLTPEYDDLAKFYKKQHAYINVNDEHYIYENNYYQAKGDFCISAFAEDHFKPKCTNLLRSEFRGKVKHKEIKPSEFFTNTTDRLINLQNGILNIDTMELLPHSPDYGFKHILDFSFDEKAMCPLFSQHLKDVTKNDENLQDILLEFMGYALSNDNPKAQKILVLTGSGQNGKSTFTKIIQRICGKGATSVSAEGLGKEFNRVLLDGALVNIMEEVPAFANRDIWETIKALTTGAEVTACRKFKDLYVFENKAKLIMTCNELPKGASANHGYFRRLLIVPFDARFEGTEDNKDLAYQIMRDELPGVLNLVLKAYKRLVANNYNFTSSERVDQALEDYKLDVDSVAHWVSENLVLGVQETKLPDGAPDWLVEDCAGVPCIDLAELYKDYRNFTEENGSKPVTRTKLTHRLREMAENLKREGKIQSGTRIEFSKQKLRGNFVSSRRVMYGVSWASGVDTTFQ